MSEDINDLPAIMAAQITAHGYGLHAEGVEAILRKISHADLLELMYVCSRAALLLGPEAFDLPDAYDIPF